MSLLAREIRQKLLTLPSLNKLIWFDFDRCVCSCCDSSGWLISYWFFDSRLKTALMRITNKKQSTIPKFQAIANNFMKVFVVQLVLGQCAFLRYGNLSFQIDVYRTQIWGLRHPYRCLMYWFTAILFVCREKDREKNGDAYNWKRTRGCECC